MKSKTIAKNIREKIDEWIASISDEELRNLLKNNVVVTGGCITSMFLQETVNDYDVYLADSKTALSVAVYYAKELTNTSILLHVSDSKYFQDFVQTDEYEDKIIMSMDNLRTTLTERQYANLERVEMFVHSRGVEEGQKTPTGTKKDKYRMEFASSNAITLSDKVQVILRFTGNPEEIHKNYDFVHTTNYWTRRTGLVTNVAALESILAKELLYSGSLYPLASILRTRKFIQRNWTSHVGNYIKMALQLNELNLFNPDVLRDQLTGVDMAYMQAVISEVEAKEKEDPSFEFNAEYLCEIVDRLMGESNASA